MEQRHLQAFVTVASLGSVSRAARHLGYSQPAVTQQIRHMEKVLGVRLFDRHSLPLQLTAEGRERLLVAEAMVLLGERLVSREAVSQPGTVSGAGTVTHSDKK